MIATVVSFAWFGAVGFAQETDPSLEETHSGTKLPALSREPTSAELHTELPVLKTISDLQNLEYPLEAYRAAEALHVEPEFSNGVQVALKAVYQRDYNAARDQFAALDTRFPGTVSRSLGDVVVWQALMLENFDYKYDKQYWTASKQARRDLEAAMAAPGNDAWEALVRATVVGIESIHTMRQGSYLSALQLAFQAMDAIEKCRAAAPEFVDLKLADGIYNYWRTVVTLESKVLPDFGDHRVEGIEQMQIVERTGMFIGPLASLSLAFTWLEEGEGEKALNATVGNRAKYPNNIINNMVAGMVLNQLHRYDKAMDAFDRILVTDPNNNRVHYWKGVTFMKQGKLDLAKAELVRYLESSYLEEWAKSYALYRLGQVAARQEDYAEAVRQYDAAVALDGNKAAKAAKDRLLERRKNKQIDW